MKNKVELECYLTDLMITFENNGNGKFMFSRPLKIVPLEQEFTFEQAQIIAELIYKNKGILKITIEPGGIRGI